MGRNTDVLVNAAFCVAKYEMKNDGSNNAVSQSAGLPWASITRDDNGGTPGAITRCQNIGSGYALISNAQWQAVAREIELAQTAGNDLNWSNGSTAGANALNLGHSDSAPSNALAASLDSDPCFGTGNVSCADNTVADFTQKRTHTLLSGEIIWDVSGNVWEWVKDDIAAGPPYEGSNNYISQQPWTAGLSRPEMWAPFGNYISKSSGSYGGLGYGNLGFSAGAVIRGGGWTSGVIAGVFAARLNNAPLDSATNLGFRCAIVP